MPENGKQHYVPRSILQNFTFEGKKIFCYLKNDRCIIPTNINNICKENKYYSFDTKDENGNILKFDYDKEVFQQIDNSIAPVIRKIIENRKTSDLEEQERQILAKYTAYQYCRVPAIRNIANSLLNDEQKAKIFHAESLRNNQFVISDLEKILMNFKLDILDSIVEDEFIISDTVVLRSYR